MKKLVSLLVVGVFVLTACNGDKLKKAEERNVTLQDSLSIALAEHDSLFSLLNEINSSMEQIKDIENVLSSTTDLNSESQSYKDKLRNDLIAIQRELKARRERLTELEKKLKNSQTYSASLKKTIETLKVQIEEQQNSINTLKNSLAAANIRIEELGQTVDSLNTEVASITQEKEIAEEETVNLANELNTCYYAIGTKGELKENRIIETGFLKKTKILKGDFEQGYFTTADKRVLTSIPTHAKKVKILTNQPADSYEIVDVDGVKTIKINNANKFWSLSNYLVVQVD